MKPAARFELLLRATMGLDVASVSAALIDHAVKHRMRACALNDADAYWHRLQDSDVELQKLIEAVVVPETWFFRDREVFTAFSRVVREGWPRTRPQRPLRILSLPCSTGEEPYSMAMSLLDDGFPMEQCRIDAVDISEELLAHARQGTYRRSSFRGDGLAFRDRYFSAVAGDYQLGDTVRRQVHFQHGNVMDPGFLPGEQIYDIIFCRNLLIYFDQPTQARSIAILERLLKPEGSLFVGAAEAGALHQHGDFVSAKIAMAFAFRKAGSLPERQEPVRPPLLRIVRRPAPLPEVRTAPASPAKAAPPPASAQPSAEPDSDLEDAKRLADEGHFVEAALRCQEHLRRHGPSAETFYLLGLVRDASGNHVDAAQYYRKALYLTPDHRDALTHLALLLEDQGKPEAQMLRGRMKRLAQRGQG